MMVEILVTLAALFSAINLILLLRRAPDARESSALRAVPRAEPAIAPQLASQLARIEARLAAIEAQGNATAERGATANANAETSSPALAAIDAKLAELTRQIDALSLREQRAEGATSTSNRPYELAQRLARQGADIQHIMSASGLSQREAELILRLHAGTAER